MTKIIVVWIFLTILTGSAFADEGEKEFCGFTYSVNSSAQTSRVYLGCAGNAESLELVIINPFSLQVDRKFPVKGLIQDVFPIEGGKFLLVLLVETDANEETSEGVLQKIDITAGEVVKELAFKRAPLAMVVDSDEKYAYVSSGINYDLTSSIDKISLDDFLVKSSVMFGDNPDDLAITSDGKKLYVKSEELFYKEVEEETTFFWKVGIIDTLNMTIKDALQVPVIPLSVEMSTDDRLFIGYSMPMSEENMDFSLLIVDTRTDKIEKELSFNEIGVADITYDPVSDMIYCIACPRTLFDKELEMYTHESTDMILAINLDDYSHTSFQLGDEPLWDITIVPFSNNTRSRIFGITESNSPKVFYRDLE
jgi:DNA-binding beta-propeller fold protein YncE